MPGSVKVQNFLKIQECDWDIGVQTLSGSLNDMLRIEIKTGLIEA